MNLLELNKENFEELIKDGLVLVDFYAEWCGPCKMLSPVLKSLAEEREDFKIIQVNVDKHSKLNQKFGIMSVPTLLLFKDREVVETKQGFQTKEMLLRWISKYQ